MHELLHYVTEKSEPRQRARTHWDFRKQYEKMRNTVAHLYQSNIPHLEAALDRAAAFEELVVNVRQKLQDALNDHIGKSVFLFVWSLLLLLQRL
jgi:hypothetical protein